MAAMGRKNSSRRQEEENLRGSRLTWVTHDTCVLQDSLN